MKVVAYCRVSTNKDEQLDSLQSQQEFFTNYCERNSYNLVNIYADEGKSGTKMKNRTQLLRLLSDATRKMFDIVLIKDVSRLARNTVDFLTSIRKMKSLGIKVIFVNYDQTSSDSSEFMLTLLSAIAQEESSNTSKRVKFGKKQNAEKGRVPNIVYGYDKIPGDYFHLNINEQESMVVRRIFDMYVNQNMGANKIAMTLNAEGTKSKRGCIWSQVAISRILVNEIYVGLIINAKQEIEDFLTGKRHSNDEEKWLITENPELRLIDDETFNRAKRILSGRAELYKFTGEHNSEKHVFSKLIRCKCCGASFRRQVRTYKNTYVKWVCTGRNSNGVDACPNKTVIDEEELLFEIRNYFAGILKEKPNVITNIVNKFNRQYKANDENEVSEKELIAQLSKVKKSRQKYMDMYEADVITITELKEKTKQLNSDIDRITEDIRMVKNNISKSDILENVLNETFKNIESVLASDHMTNEMLGRILERIEVDEHQKTDIYLKLFSDIGLDENVLIVDNRTYGCNIIERFWIRIA